MLRVVLVAASIGATALVGFTQTDRIDTILAHPLQWDGKHVHVTGAVMRLEERTALDGRDYDVFDLCNAGCIRVFTGGRPALSEGQKLSVQGTFSSAKRVGDFDVDNDIETDEGSL
ncbi:MAG TPA: hypothetical protein VME66_03630 [Candidatus Acidoferrales bacterium]|nr:hypothetical protein [Candidatus Acidoferrales bacterium]